MSIGEIWEEMEAQTVGNSSPGIVARRIHPRADVDLFVAIRVSTASRLLILKCQPPVDYRSEDLPVSRGFTIGFVQFPDDQTGIISVELESAGLPFREVFTVLVDDVAADLAANGRKGVELDVLRTRLGRWRNFFEQHDPEGLGEEAQRGLFGELWCLRELMIPNVRPVSVAIEGWTGPTAAAKDFELPGCAIEVKSSLSKQHHRVLIANELQLDDVGFENLFLLCLLLEKVTGSGESLPTLVATIRTLLSEIPAAWAEYEERLIRAGYLDVHQSIYSKTHYAVRDHQLFRVKEGFPRIVSSDMQPGVGDVRYSVVLSACTGFRIADSEITTFLTSTNNDS